MAKGVTQLGKCLHVATGNIIPTHTIYTDGLKTQTNSNSLMLHTPSCAGCMSPGQTVGP